MQVSENQAKNVENIQLPFRFDVIKWGGGREELVD
jgi:hypothetical protein